MKVVGIIALVLAIVAIFIPASLYVTWVAFILASIAAFSRDGIRFAILTSLIGAINVVFLSPMTLVTSVVLLPLLLVTIVLGAAPIVISVIRIMIGTSSRSTVKVLRT